MSALQKIHSEFPVRVLGVSVPAPVREHRFHHTRKWRFDFAWVEQRVALEVDGGIWTQGRHSRGAGQLADMEKLNEAATLGWRVLRVTPKQLRNGEATLWINRALQWGRVP